VLHGESVGLVDTPRKDDLPELLGRNVTQRKEDLGAGDRRTARPRSLYRPGYLTRDRSEKPLGREFTEDPFRMAAVGQSRSQEHAFCLYQCLPQLRCRALRHGLDDETAVAPRIRSPPPGWPPLRRHGTETSLPALALRQADLLAEGPLEPGSAAGIGSGQAPGRIGYVARARHGFPDHGQQIGDLLGRTLPARRSLGRSRQDNMVDGEMHEGNGLGQYRVERGWAPLAQ